jgi:choline dehydrogenase
MTRASRIEHNTWSALSNSTAWDFETMLEYYKKHESFNIPTEQYSQNAGGIVVDEDYHGFEGPVHYARAG